MNAHALPRIRITFKDWIRIGTELFGPDRKQWKFQCVACGHEQSVVSIRAAHPELTADRVDGVVTFSCEGRLATPPRKREKRPDPAKGCDWTLGGLFQIHQLEVADPDGGGYVPMFEYAHEKARTMVEACAITESATVPAPTGAP